MGGRSKAEKEEIDSLSGMEKPDKAFHHSYPQKKGEGSKRKREAYKRLPKAGPRRLQSREKKKKGSKSTTATQKRRVKRKVVKKDYLRVGHRGNQFLLPWKDPFFERSRSEAEKGKHRKKKRKS